MIAKSKEEFEKAAEGLPVSTSIDLSAEVVCVEPIGASYFRSEGRQRCIVRDKLGRLSVSFYD